MDTQTQILIVMIAYLSLLILWGLYQGRKVKTDSDYAIAGRKLPGWVAALSERATGESSWALLGLPGAAYATGLTEIWTAIGCAGGILTAWITISWRLRGASEKYEVNTFTEFIAKKHGEVGRWIRIVGSFTIVFFFFFYVGAQFLGGGKTLESMFGVETKWGMLITAVIIIPYTIYGGFRSVVYTDVIQAIVMITALILGPIVGIIYLANHPEVFAQSVPQALDKAGTAYTSLTGGATGFMAGVVLVGGLSWFFGYLGGQPQLSMRFMAISDERQAKKARNIGIIWTIIAYIGALFIGWLGIAIFGPDGLQDQEMVMPEVFLKIFPPAIAAVLITGAIAAMISTADSLLILSSSELSENLLKPALKTQNKAKLALKHSRITTALLAVIALLLAYISPSDMIYTIVGYVWAGIGSTFSVVILLTLFWKRYHGRAVLVTIITGLIFTIIWFSSGMEKHYRVTEDTITAVEADKVPSEASSRLSVILDERFSSENRFKKELKTLYKQNEYEEYSGAIIRNASVTGVSARFLTFVVALFVAVLSSYLIPKKE
ncbi:MAG: sodium/proline symporter [Bacteroidales bacterium]|nr:sodium/proline symporter [Bacteroidales bacterium]